MNWLSPLANAALYPWLCLALGLCIGSFLNAVIHRLPKMLENEWRQQCSGLLGETIPPASQYNLCVPRSNCPGCGHRIRAWENIPVFGYIFLRGKCSSCGKSIGLRYPAIELFTGLVSAYVGWRYGATWAGAGILLLCWALIALAFIDLDTQLLPDDITLPLLWAGLLINTADTYVPLAQAVTGAAAGYLALWSVYWLFKLVTGKEGMGYGDFKLLAALGAWLGWKMLLPIVLLSSISGAIVGLGLIVFARHGRNIPIPFGPYLVLGGVVALFWGDTLLRGYLPFLL
ncbi:MAG: prepilin peptidase [Betaproteobacteria bacterium]|nr:prepilin peptidase [Betaproteobacteria bacterium]